MKIFFRPGGKRAMKRHALCCAMGLLILTPRANAQKSFTLEQVMSAPFPSSLIAAKNSNRIAWVLDGVDKPQQLVVRGQNFGPHWSPDGSGLAFVSARTDHAFIGVYDVATKTIQFIAPSVDSDANPAWSLDGKRIAFVRRPAEPRDEPQGFFIAPDKPHRWAIWIADVPSGTAHEIWHSSATPQGSFPYMAEDTGGGVI